MARLHEKYLPRFDTERVAELGSELRDETEQIIGMIEAAVGVAVGFDESLTETDRKLATASIDRDTLRGIIEAVVLATRDMQQENAKLGKNLNQSKQNISQLQESLIAVRMESLTDALTGLANRRHFDAALSDVIAAAETAREPVSLLMADVDHFKRFNDAHGHQLGDQVLRLMATALKQCVKGQDIVARYGGEEFAIILPNTELDEAVAVANNIRTAVAAHEVVKRSTSERLGRMSLSVGVARHRAGMTAQELIECADACLYRAKMSGRDQVIADTDTRIDRSAAPRA